MTWSMSSGLEGNGVVVTGAASGIGREVARAFAAAGAQVAGVLIRRKHVDEVTEVDWNLQHDVNLKAIFFLNRAAGRIFLEQGRA